MIEKIAVRQSDKENRLIFISNWFDFKNKLKIIIFKV